MTDYQIFKKLRPLIIKRIIYALSGLLLMIGVLVFATIWGMKCPEYRVEIIFLCAVLGIFIGWRIIRRGEARYRLAQVAIITEALNGDEKKVITKKQAMDTVKKTFKYSSPFRLLKNILKHKNFKKLGQFVSVTIANMLPYVGSCSLSWVFAHPDEDREQGACRAISNYYTNRKAMRKKVIMAFLKEWLTVIVIFFVVFGIEWCIYKAILLYVTDLDTILDKVEDYTDTIELVYEWYFENGRGYSWNPVGIMTVIALYITWFIKIFGIRSFQSISVIRDYLAAGEKNPPSDELYEKLMEERKKKNK